MIFNKETILKIFNYINFKLDVPILTGHRYYSYDSSSYWFCIDCDMILFKNNKVCTNRDFAIGNFSINYSNNIFPPYSCKDFNKYKNMNEALE